MDPLVSTIQGFPLVTTVLSYYDTGDTDLRADDRQAVLIVVRSEDPTVSHNGDIDVQPMLDEVDKANTSTPDLKSESSVAVSLKTSLKTSLPRTSSASCWYQCSLAWAY